MLDAAPLASGDPMAGNDPSTAATSRTDMGHVARRLSSLLLRVVASPARRTALRRTRELRRRLAGAPHRVHYFHQVDDAYGHLAAQALAELGSRYAVELLPHLVSATTGPDQPEPELLAALARRDATLVAPHYGLDFPIDAAQPAPEAVRLAQRVLAHGSPEGFAERAVRVGDALWRGDKEGLQAAAAELGAAEEPEADRALAEGNALRDELGHYSGAMFSYAGEWYWGVDRLHHLEQRLDELGAARGEGGPRFARPRLAMEPVARGAEMTLEVFPSLRSPYTAVGFGKAVELAERSGVRLVVRPVLPMVMRGVPVTLRKGFYIFQDTKREAETLGVPFGRVVDPIGEPVRRAYSLWPWARERDAGPAFLAAFLRGAFAEGVDTSTDAGMRRVVESARLPWDEAQRILGDDAWEAELESNRVALYDEMGLWGVPSFRLRGPAGEPDLCTWGQDRLWLVAREIQRRG